MFERRRWHRITAILLVLTMFFTSIPGMAFAESNSTSEEPDAGEVGKSEETLLMEENLQLEESVSEDNIIDSENTTESTTFDLGDGKRMIIYHGQDVRYETEEGKLEDYDPSLVELKSEESETGERLSDYAFENRKGDIKHYIPKKLKEETPVITENGKYSLSMVPIDETVEKQSVKKEKEPVLMPYEEVKEKQIRAVYKSEKKKYAYAYSSLNQGIKETIILEENPENNVFLFRVNVKGMTAELDEKQNMILFKDKKTEKTVASIDKPFMNDASGEAYSEDLVYALEEEKSGSYLLTLTISREYLDDEDRIYPVSVDPTATWKGSEEFLDAYVISGDYADINFYDSDVRLMVAGKGIDGSYRTYIKLPNIKSTLEDKYVDSAYLTVYESGDCDPDQTIRLNRITESWSPSTITWSNKPTYYSDGYINNFTTDGKQYAAHKVTMTNTVRNYVNSTNNPNYGIVMRNVTSSPEFAEFYGSRTTLTSYRPKLVVTYYDKPTVADTVSVSRKSGDEYINSIYLRKGYNKYVSWTGIVSQNLSAVQYKILGLDDTPDPTSVSSDNVDLSSYRSIGVATKNGSNVKIPYGSYLPAGRYRIYIRGKDAGGMYGTAKYKNFYVDAAPEVTGVSISPSTSSTKKTNNLRPVVKWTSSSTHFDEVQVKINGKADSAAPAGSGTKSYTVSSGMISGDGTHTIVITAYDLAGNSTSVEKSYYVDKSAPGITLDVSPKTASGSSTKDTTPTVNWKITGNDIDTRSLTINGTSVGSISGAEGTWSGTTGVKEGENVIKLTATDKAGNTGSAQVKYYLDTTKPVVSSFSVTPDSGTASMSNDSTPAINWTVTEKEIKEVLYSIDSGAFTKAGSSNTGTLTLPSIGADGSHTITFKAVDQAGNESTVKSVSYYLDTTKPVFSSKSISPQATSSAPKNNKQPKISWNITETNLDKVYYSIDSTAAADYVEMSTAQSGTFTIPAGKLASTKEHTIRLKAADKAGNVSVVQSITYYLDVTKPVISSVSTNPTTSSASLTKNLTPKVSWTSSEAQPAKVEYQIDDKAYKQAGTAASGSFSVPAGEITASGVHTIRVRMTDKAGNVSNPVETSYYVDVDAPVFSSLEMTKSSFLFPSANRAPVITWKIEDAAMKNVYYSVNGGEAVCVNSGAEGSVTLPETVWGNTENGKFIISVYAEDLAGNKCEAKTLTYYLKSVENPEEYVPKDITVTESYGKRVITWKLSAYDGIKASYTLHRGTAADFVPSDENLVTDDFDVTSLLYIDNEILETGTHYYKIAVKDLTGDAGAEDYVSDAVAFENIVDIEQFSSRLGLKDYLSYLEIGLPTGTMHIEESSGNLVYDQNDYSFAAPAFSMDMDRTYNSMSKRTAMVGAGWSDSYHQEIYTYGDDLYFVDTDGSAYFFEKQEDGSFVCAETKEFTLKETSDGYTITSKDEVVSTFNESGQLSSTAESNGYILENVYDHLGRLVEVRIIHGGTEIRNLEFAYDENSFLLDSVTMPDESVIAYNYSGKTLTSAVYGGITYAYRYGDNGVMNTAYDGEGNPYTVSYTDGKVKEVSYPDGEKYLLAYNVENTNQTEIQKYAEEGGLFYTESTMVDLQTGKMLSHTDPAGETVSYTYGDERNPYLLTESSKEVSYYTLDEETAKVYESDLQKTILSSFVYDGNGNITSEIAEDGSVTVYTYDDKQRVNEERTTRDGMTTAHITYGYDAKGNMVQSTEHITGQVTVYTLDDYSNILTEVVKEDGIVLSTSASTYDIYGNVLTTESTEGGITSSTAYTYDIMGRTLITVSPGMETTYTYDESGREVQSVTEEEGLETVVTDKSYDDNGTLVSEISTTGRSCEYSYDERNRVTSQVVSGDGMEPRITETEYGAVGPEGNMVYVETVTTSGSISLFSAGTDRQTQTRYIDGTGKVLKEVDDMLQTEYTYDKAGNLLTSETATSDQGMAVLEEHISESVNTDDTVLTLYNEYGEAEVFITEPEAGDDSAYVLSEASLVSKQSFDGLGNLQTETSPKGITAVYSYDAQGRMTGCDVNGDGTMDTAVSYNLTEEGNTVTTITDANGNVRTETVNAAGLVLETRDIASEPDGNDLYTIYVYDEQGRKVMEEYSDGSWMEYAYTSENSDRVSTETAYRTDGMEESSITYLYDDYGRVSSVTVSRDGNAVSTTSWTYDVEGKKLSETVAYGNQPEQTTRYIYDVFGRIVEVVYPNESELGTISYTYDTAGNISSIYNDTGIVREYDYSHMGQLSVIRDYVSPGFEEYVEKHYSYDDNGRITTMSSQNDSGDTLEGFAYEYDKNSQIIEETHINNLLEESKKINETTVYTYDDFGRLAQSAKTNHQNSNAQSMTTYGYDGVGNRVSMTENDVETVYTYNSLNQLMSSAENGETTTYAYDLRGNQISESKGNILTENTYSVRGEMLSTMKLNGDLLISGQENQYNHDGIRISKNEGGATRYYYYDNGALVYTEDETILSSANIVGPEGQIIGTYRGSDYHVYLKDIQGSTTNIVKEDGSLSATYEYSDFGETEELTGSNFNNEICYTGAVYDDTTGLYYMNARYYDPKNGRFISKDTYRGEPNDPAQWHLYAYCANSPINYIDTSGHKAKKIVKEYATATYRLEFGQLPMLAEDYRSNADSFVIIDLSITTGTTIFGLCGWGPAMAVAGISYSLVALGRKDKNVGFANECMEFYEKYYKKYVPNTKKKVKQGTKIYVTEKSSRNKPNSFHKRRTKWRKYDISISFKTSKKNFKDMQFE